MSGGSRLARVTQSCHSRVVGGVHGGRGGVHVLQGVGIIAPVTSLARQLVCHAVTSVQVLELLSLLMYLALLRVEPLLLLRCSSHRVAVPPRLQPSP